jgi:hypothetical protein
VCGITGKKDTAETIAWRRALVLSANTEVSNRSKTPRGYRLTAEK